MVFSEDLITATRGEANSLEHFLYEISEGKVLTTSEEKNRADAERRLLLIIAEAAAAYNELVKEATMEEQLEELMAEGKRKAAEEKAEPVRAFHATPEEWEIINNAAEKRTPESLAAFLQLLADTLNGKEAE